MTNREAYAILNEAYLKSLDHQFIAFENWELEALRVAMRALEQSESPPNYKLHSAQLYGKSVRFT